MSWTILAFRHSQICLQSLLILNSLQLKLSVILYRIKNKRKYNKKKLFMYLDTRFQLMV